MSAATATADRLGETTLLASAMIAGEERARSAGGAGNPPLAGAASRPASTPIRNRWRSSSVLAAIAIGCRLARGIAAANVLGKWAIRAWRMVRSRPSS
jgi:hypothetical protein